MRLCRNARRVYTTSFSRRVGVEEIGILRAKRRYKFVIVPFRFPQTRSAESSTHLPIERECLFISFVHGAIKFASCE